VTGDFRRAARRAGIVDRYVDGLGVRRVAPESAVRALMDALARDEGRSVAPGVLTTRPGARRLRIKADLEGRKWRAGIVLEDGSEAAARIGSGGAGNLEIAFDQRLPLGVHRLVLERARVRRQIPLLAAPRTLRVPTEKRLAVFLPLYSVQTSRGLGVGTFAELAELVRWAEEAARAFVGTLPLFPAFLDKPFDPSPYAPVSRLFWNELFIDPTRAPEWRAPEVRRLVAGAPFRKRAAAARRGRYVDYQLSWRLTRLVLGAMSRAARARPARWAEIDGSVNSGVARYARFRAAVEATSAGWHDWPSRWRRGEPSLAEIDRAAIDAYTYAQSLAESQVSRLWREGRSISPLYLDLPVGVHAAGYDVWRHPELFLQGISAGAPPDGLHAGGQTWGFPPMHPTAGRADGYAHLRAILRRMFGVAGVVRIDHVMWLQRMYCIMPGFAADEGAYLSYPVEELLAIVMIEAARAGAVVVGEDLGTVPDSMRRRMRRSGILGMHVQQFAFGDEPGSAIQEPPAHCLASLNTHDTPTFAAFWRADDVTLRQSLGHIDAAGAKRERAWRRRMQRAVRAGLRARGLPARDARSVGVSLMRLQARSAAPITLVNLEDLWGERRPQNVPGTSAEHPNWRRRAARSLSALQDDRSVNGALRAIAADRRQPKPRQQRSRP
jgi:4-alpha-glucanotransferase